MGNILAAEKAFAKMKIFNTLYDWQAALVLVSFYQEEIFVYLVDQ